MILLGSMKTRRMRSYIRKKERVTKMGETTGKVRRRREASGRIVGATETEEKNKQDPTIDERVSQGDRHEDFISHS